MLKRILFSLLAALLCGAWLPHGSGSPPSLPFPLSYYATFANGPPTVTSYFPIGVWEQSPQVTTGYSGSHPTLAAAAAAMGINFINFITPPWPTSFGADAGQLAAAKAAGVQILAPTDYTSNTNAASVPSIQSLITADSAQKTIFAYTIGDELFCGTIGSVASAATTAIQANDTTRFITSNYSGQAAGGNTSPYGCAGYTTATPIFSINGFDLYTITSPPAQTTCIALSGVGPTSDFISVPNDCIWTEGIGVLNLISYAANRPVWVIVEAGSDTLASTSFSSFSTSVTSGSNIVTNTSHHVFGASPDTQTTFTASWIGLTLNDSTCISGTVVSVTDATHLVLSANASCNNTTGTTVVSGGANGGGCLSNNLCLPNGNEYRATPAEVSGEAWNAIISGAVGITWFCQDGTSSTFCLGDSAGGSAATAAQANLVYIDGVLALYAPQLNTTTAGICSMQNVNFTVSTSCTNGTLTMATSTSDVPGLAMLKQPVAGISYLFAMSDRRSATGATMTFTATGLAGKVATVVYDSNSQYDNANNNVGATFTLNGSAQFSDTFGAHADSYQVRIYKIQ